MILSALASVLESTFPSVAPLGLRFDRDGLVCIGLVALIVFLATSTRRSARRCPRCREVNREQARFCAQCGAPLR
ncbi:MAG: zinc-ribbon domain-containing protein [Planctomycetota bacterium]